MLPTRGAVGVKGCISITAFNDPAEIHPKASVTENVYVVFSVKLPNTPVVAGPDPDITKPPGVAVTVHAPEFGRPLISTLPVATVHVG